MEKIKKAGERIAVQRKSASFLLKSRKAKAKTRTPITKNSQEGRPAKACTPEEAFKASCTPPAPTASFATAPKASEATVFSAIMPCEVLKEVEEIPSAWNPSNE